MSSPGSMREERRTVTALFADVAGSTALGDRLDPEDVREIVGEAVRLMAEAVERFGGTVKDIAGDGVLALFGAPVAHEDDAERPVRAGLEIQRQMARHAEVIRRDRGISGLGVRIGIESGLVVTGPVGGGSRIEYGATGDVVNTASRLQNQARVGSVIVGPSARAQVEPLFAWSEPVALELKGKAAPVHAAEALSPREDASRARHLPGRGAPLVGRDAELGAAAAAIGRLATGAGCVIAISGEAGIGKSRLLETLRTDPASTVRWLEGACTSFASSTPYAPLTQLLGSWERIDSAGRPPEDLLPSDRPDARAALAVLGGHAGAHERAIFDELSPEGRQLATVDGLRAFLRAVGAASPLVVAVEDLHWCDASSLHALERLLPLAASDAVAFVLTTRPDPGAVADAILERVGRPDDSILRIELDALPAGADRELVAALVGEGTLPPALLERLLEVGGGNPFFIGELVRSLFDTRTLVASNGGWTVVPDARPELPPTVDRVLLARIDRLPDQDRDVLTAASVLGRRFSSTTLEELLDRDPTDALERLERIELVRHEPPEHAFTHALVQESAYATLLRKRRRELHARAAAVIEAQPGADDRAALLGRHHAGAGNAEDAFRWFVTAADRAEVVSALLEAIEDLDQAISVAGAESPVVPELRFRRGRLRARTGDYRGARHDLDQALRAAVDGADRSLEMRCRDEIGFLVAGSADYRESVEHLERALAIADELGDTAGRVSALSRLTITWANRLQLDRAQRSGELALQAASTSNDDELVAIALDALKPVALMLGRLDDIERYSDELRPLYARRNDRWLQQFVDLETGFVSLARCRFDEARQRFNRSLEVNRELHDVGNEPLHLGAISQLHRCHGEVDAAVEVGRRAFQLARERGHEEWIAYTASRVGGTLLQAGARSEAIDVLETGAAAADRAGADFHGLRCVGLLIRAWVRSDPEKVPRLLPTAQARIDVVGLPLGETLLYACDGILGVATGWLAESDPKRALGAIDPIVDACVERSWPESVVDASLVQAAAMTVVGDQEAGHRAAHRAEEWSRRHGLRLYEWRAAAAAAAASPDRDETRLATERARAAAAALLDSVTDASVRGLLEVEVDRVLTKGETAWA